MADIGILLLLRSVCRHNVLLLYAWSPLLIKEFAFTAHPDVFAVFMALLAIRLRHTGHALLTGTFLGLALGIKVFAILLAPFVLIHRGNLRQSIHAAAAFFLTLLVITVWFGSLKIWFPEGLLVMADSWLFNAPLYLLLTKLISFELTKTLLLTVFFIFALALWHKQYFAPNAGRITRPDFPDKSVRGDLLYGSFLLCIPVLNPWYAVWVLPFAVLHPSRWAWTASVAVLLSYSTATGSDGSPLALYQVPLPILMLESGLIALAAFIDWRYPSYGRHRDEKNSAA